MLEGGEVISWTPLSQKISSFPEDQKVLLLDHLLQRYQGLARQMKSEVTVKPAVVLPKSEPAPPLERTSDLNNLSSTSLQKEVH